VVYIFLLSVEIFLIVRTREERKLCDRGPRLARGETSDGIAVHVHACLVRVPLSTLQRAFLQRVLCRGACHNQVHVRLMDGLRAQGKKHVWPFFHTGPETFHRLQPPHILRVSLQLGITAQLCWTLAIFQCWYFIGWRNVYGVWKISNSRGSASSFSLVDSLHNGR
jgi:hypothetical protein